MYPQGLNVNGDTTEEEDNMPVPVEYDLPNAPTDGITSVQFAPAAGSPMLLASSWDSHVRLYNVAAGEKAFCCLYTHTGPVLDCCFSDPNHAFSGGLDRSLIAYDFMTQQQTTLGY